MNTNRWLVHVSGVSALGIALVAFPMLAQDTSKDDKTKTTDSQSQSDNTRENKKHRGMTADRTSSASDRELTQKIRKAITDDKSLSSKAHNVKILAKDGMVTLKGPVSTEEEKKTIESKATEIAGSGKVANEITIAPAKGTKSHTDTSKSK